MVEMLGSSHVFTWVYRAVRRGVLPIVVALVASLLVYVPAVEAAPRPSPGQVFKDRSVAVSKVPTGKPAASQSDTTVDASRADVAWPVAGSAVVDLSNGPVSALVGGLPVLLSPPPLQGDVLSERLLADLADTSDVPDQVRIEVAGRDEALAAGVALLLRVAAVGDVAPDTGVRVELDYSGFQDAFGAGWASRLRMVEMSECALTDVLDPECAGPAGLGSRNDPIAGRIAADVELPADSARPSSAEQNASAAGAAVVALLAGASGETGTFGRTPLAESASWQAGQSGGGFSWSYPLSMPPAPGGLEPDVSFDYSSAAVDGRTNGENTQTSWIGEGWDFHPGYIERSYRVCADDLDGFPASYPSATPDPCWRESNAKLVWQGKSTEIVQGDADGRWRLADDDGSRIDLLTGQHGWSHNGETWRLTTTDGTQFYFGRQRLPGWNAGDRETDSVMAQATFSNHNWEPCYQTTGFYNSRCFQAYRWNLDYVVDPHGNSMSYWYGREMNRAGITGVGQYQVQYDRGSILRRIEYGTRAGTEADTLTPPMQVLFDIDDRCLTSCWSGTTPVAANWPDTPWDLQCNAAPCNNNIGPSYFSEKRLTAVRTQVRVGGAYQDVDRWDLGHSYPVTNESNSLNPPALWLTGITHTGQAGTGGSQALPTVTFGGTRYANRTDHNVSAAVPVTNKYRITQINTETGGQIEITYEGSDCTVTSQADPDNNSKRCFPQYYKPEGSPAGWSWWNKYRVTQVVERDLVGGSPPVIHAYAYSTTGASSAVLWHHNDTDVWARSLPLRTWSDFRGWPTVTTTTGTAGGPQTQTKSLYFRGMHHDTTDAGPGTRHVTLTGSDGVAHGDDGWRAGHLLEETEYATPNGQPLSRTLQFVWGSQTSSRTEDPIHAQPINWQSVLARVTTTDSYTWLPGSSTWRQTKTINSWDTTYGLLTSTDEQGDVNSSTDNTCTRYSYARNTGAPWLIDTVSRVEIVAKPCGSTVSYPQDLIADERYFYDDLASHGAAPTRGLVTKTEEASAHSGTAATYVTTLTGSYDAHGRVRTAKDALNRSTETEYTPPTGGPTTSVKVTNALEQDATTTLDPRRGLPTSVSDINDKISTAEYDTLGRLTRMWRPGRGTATTPDEEYAYTISKTAPSHVRTRILGPNGNQIESYDIYDGLLRPRQEQTTAPDGKRAITDTQYDNRGLPAKASNFYNNASGPSGTLLGFNDANVASQTRLTYDGLERPATEELWSNNVFKWQTATTYGGDRVNIDPPDGAVATTTIYDALDRPTTLRQYHGGAISGTYNQTTYQYDLSDQLTKVTDPVGNEWSNTYDLRGRLTSRTDPDAGTSSFTYDIVNRLETSTDPRGEKLARIYDNLDRLTHLRDDSASGPIRSSYLFDTIALGQLTSATRHVGADAYITAVGEYNDDYQPKNVTTTIPGTQGTLGGTYTSDYTFHVNGSPASSSYPAAGGLPAETVNYTYTGTGYLNTATGIDTYLASATYEWDGALREQLLGSGGQRVRLTGTRDEATGWLAKSEVHTERPGTPNNWDEKLTEQYSYQPGGNVTAITETAAGATVSKQCFQYDGLRRLTEAWTTTVANCQTTPTQTAILGPDPYWQSYTYNAIGNRLTDTRHTTTGNTTRDYHYPTATNAKPHTLTSTTTSGGGPTTSYTYDPSGNLSTRTGGGLPNQTLTYDAEGTLANITSGINTHSYIYNATGNRVIADDPGTVTLYLGSTELRRDKNTNQVTATRYYPGAIRTTTDGLAWLAADHHGTGQLAIDADTLTTTRRKTLPFGETRGTAPTTWPDHKGFVGGTTDPTGYTHLGAREYDPSTGRFVSVDPILDLTDPQSMHGYAYSNNNPISFSDPDGLKLDPFAGGAAGSAAARSGSGGGYGLPGAGSLAHLRSMVKTNLGKIAKKLGKASNKAKATLRKGAGRPATSSAADEKAVMRARPAKPAPKPASKTTRKPDPKPAPKTKSKSKPASGTQSKGSVKKSSGKTTDCKSNSFVPDTPVLMADGTTKEIKKVDVGDKVLATDPETGETASKEVTQLIIGSGQKQLVRIDVDVDGGHGDGVAEIVATDKHPFWNAGLNAWVDADAIEVGDTLITPSGQTVEVAGTFSETAELTVHNLTVADIHTYYVLADETPVLVHNCKFDRDDEAAKLPAYEGGPTSGRAVAEDGTSYDLVSGNKREDAALIGWVNNMLQKRGVLPGRATSWRASDVEQKFAAIMDRDGITDADLVINFPTGPCTVRLGCDQVLNTLLGDKRSLTVHWQESGGAWQSRKYGRR